MKIKEIVEALEKFAPLPLQEGYDNAGLQIGLTGSECSGALLCLDVTEAVIEEAVQKGMNLIIAHHPLLFRGLKCVADTTYVERCVRTAIRHDLCIYAAHTNLDNVAGGVSHEMARRLEMRDIEFLMPATDGKSGSGIIGYLPHPIEAQELLRQLKTTFATDCIQYSVGKQSEIHKVALCGGSGDFLIEHAVRQGADLFLTGEIGYHHFFGRENEIWLAAIGHYQSEQYTIALLECILRHTFSNLRVAATSICTNPIRYI